MTLVGLITSRRLGPLTIAQALGALNDNLVKNAMLVLALFRLHVGSTGLSALAGALFIAPYILLSATAGTLADRVAKHRLVVAYKLMELALMTGAAAAFWTENIPALLAVLGGLGVQAALFGPVKYGILPEYLADAELLGGNGIIEATTFLAIICGTIAGSWLVQLPQGPALVGAIGVVLAMAGVLAAQRLPELPPANPDLTVSANIFCSTWHILRFPRRNRPAWRSILALSWFWTIGATVLTELPIITRDVLHAESQVLTLLLGVFAIGVGIGSIGCARLLHDRVSTRIAPLAGLGISFFCWEFARATMHPADTLVTVWQVLAHIRGWRMLADLALLAACGGAFSVPLYALVQQSADPGSRSRMVAANNVMNALFMVLGSAAVAGLAAYGLSASSTLSVAAGANLLVVVRFGLMLNWRPSPGPDEQASV